MQRLLEEGRIIFSKRVTLAKAPAPGQASRLGLADVWRTWQRLCAHVRVCMRAFIWLRFYNFFSLCILFSWCGGGCCIRLLFVFQERTQSWWLESGLEAGRTLGRGKYILKMMAFFWDLGCLMVSLEINVIKTNCRDSKRFVLQHFFLQGYWGSPSFGYLITFRIKIKTNYNYLNFFT